MWNTTACAFFFGAVFHGLFIVFSNLFVHRDTSFFGGQLFVQKRLCNVIHCAFSFFLWPREDIFSLTSFFLFLLFAAVLLLFVGLVFFFLKKKLG